MWIFPLILGALALGVCAIIINAEIREWWDNKKRRIRERQRSMDLQMLWPACVDLAPDMTHARVAFAIHVFQDEAWTADYSDDELFEIIDALEIAMNDLPKCRCGHALLIHEDVRDESGAIVKKYGGPCMASLSRGKKSDGKRNGNGGYCECEQGTPA